MKSAAIKLHHAVPPGTRLDNAAATSTSIDLADYPGAKGVLWVYGLGATDVAPAVMKIQEADARASATSLTTPTDLHDVVTKPGTGSDNGLFGVFVPLDKARKRYQQAAFTAGNGTAGTFVSVLAIVIGGDHDFDATSFGLTSLEQAA